MADLRFDDAGLLPVIAQDRHTGEVRMVGFADEEALRATLQSGEAHFHSRSRDALWKKGESSGNVLHVSEVWTDCDADTVLYLCEPTGPTCHTGKPSCFFRRVDGALNIDDVEERALPALEALFETLKARQRSDGGKSYTKSLLEKGPAKIGEKLREEADELAVAVQNESDERVVSEAADVMYHLAVGLLSRGVSMADVQKELARRFGVSGHAEKAGRG